MKICASIRSHHHIIKEIIIECEQQRSPMPDDWFCTIDYICQKLELARPVMLSRHAQDLCHFSRSVFRADDFMESVDFHSFELEIFPEKKH